MRRLMIVPLLSLALAGCGLETPSPSTGYLPADTFGNRIIGEDPAIAATDAATDAFAHPGAMQGRPAKMALAVASLDAMAGQFATGGRWLGMNSLAKQQMLAARGRVRRILGIAPGTPSQTVIDAMVGAAHQLRHGNRPGALEALASPGFTFPPAHTLAVLAHFPPVPLANQATMFASRYLFPGGSGLPPFSR
ncbi:hypothetical protein AiwAL_17155 [Acidiphilium sp. AL]|uniref:Lipoprotein n=1 Tax=Acidiphilium iwatense TaxID=768198 RepID=A0ABS9E0J2_9PROT|nr:MULTISPECIES: hypothetical protein [Acidiphilium]MCF3947915.1 hypothetical protein [Acidiphilium iwatense]MCU4161807.1 hypothetical protein [Acidiphilium sp. AL]